MPLTGHENDIAQRFSEEREEIQGFVSLLLAELPLRDLQIQQINRTLRRFEIEQLPVRHPERECYDFTREEVADLLKAVPKTVAGIDEAWDDYDARRGFVPTLLHEPAATENLSLLLEWTDFFLRRISRDPDDEEIIGLIDAVLRDAESKQHAMEMENQLPLEELHELLHLAAETAKNDRLEENIADLRAVQRKIEELPLRGKVSIPGDQIHALRQGFILLMTAFDAAVTDLIRAGLRNDFYRRIRLFGDKEKVSLEEIAEAGGDSALKDLMIERQLKKRYLKELLQLLRGFGVPLVPPGSQFDPVALIELVLRRNLHVHQRGIVDARYLDPDSDDGKPKFNLYSLNLGDYAEIDKAYFQRACELCENCVQCLAAWRHPHAT